jgi:4-amino-4-deoxy-L-arabinose transferase-like glycosyltransferase
VLRTRPRALMELMERLKGWAIAHPVLFIFIAALIVRVTVALVLSATSGMGPFPDARAYDRLASDRATGAYHEWNAEASFFYNRLAGYVAPVAVLYRVFGRHILLAQLVAAIFGAVAAGTICRLTLLVSNRRTALAAGAIVAFFPSHVLWSSVAYKDSAVWAASAGAALLAARAARARGWRLVLIGAGLGALVFALGHLRMVTTVAVCCALVLAALVSDRAARPARVLGALAIAVLMPWYIGIGPAGVDLLQPAGAIRAAGACNARSAFTNCDAGTDTSADASVGADLGHLPRGLSVMLVEPAPWASVGGAELRLAQLELVFWLPLLAAAGWGLPEAYRRRRELACIVLTAGAMLVAYALGEGNLGTAYRHRSELIPALAVLAALGVARIMSWWRDRRPAPVSDQRV